ncbi:hypothetical protein TNCV_760421 [Trichonephila clavipes]|nr:hypothetical protein TNCV_760421 [Trichonephila clavipes]
MWSKVAQRLTRITPPAATPDPLWQRVEAALSAVPQGHIRSLFESMPKCIAAVICKTMAVTLATNSVLHVRWPAVYMFLISCVLICLFFSTFRSKNNLITNPTLRRRSFDVKRRRHGGLECSPFSSIYLSSLFLEFGV